MTLVLDASVLVKWLLRDPDRELYLEQAQRIMDDVGAGRIELFESVHWLVEVVGVIARLSPQTVSDDLILLYQLVPRIGDDLDLHKRACSLSVTLDHHLFDTLYFAKAKKVGHIISLSDWGSDL